MQYEEALGLPVANELEAALLDAISDLPVVIAEIITAFGIECNGNGVAIADIARRLRQPAAAANCTVRGVSTYVIDEEAVLRCSFKLQYQPGNLIWFDNYNQLENQDEESCSETWPRSMTSAEMYQLMALNITPADVPKGWFSNDFQWMLCRFTSAFARNVDNAETHSQTHSLYDSQPSCVQSRVKDL